jgi:hypothetical protein
MMKSPIVLLLLTCAVSNCAGRAQKQGETTMPSPEGCFVQVWDAPRFTGITEYINGPRTYTNLRDLPGARIWANRIRSVKTGVAASATVYGDENFTGPSMRLMADREYAMFPKELSGEIESMRIDCPRAIAALSEQPSISER